MSRSDDHFALCAGKTRRRRWSANTDVSLLKGETNLATARASNITAPTQFIAAKDGRYAYRRFGAGSGLPLMWLQHFTGTLDNWDPAVTDPLASGREVILFDNAGVGRSNGEVPQTIPGMAAHALAFVDALGITQADLLGYSL